MELVCCCLSQVFFYKKNLFHLITTLRCSNIDQDSQPNTPTHTPPPRKEERGKLRKREMGKGSRITPHTTPTPQTKEKKRRKGKRKGKRGREKEKEQEGKKERRKERRGGGERGSLCVWSGYDVWCRSRL